MWYCIKLRNTNGLSAHFSRQDLVIVNRVEIHYRVDVAAKADYREELKETEKL